MRLFPDELWEHMKIRDEFELRLRLQHDGVVGNTKIVVVSASRILHGIRFKLNMQFDRGTYVETYVDATLIVSLNGEWDKITCLQSSVNNIFTLVD